MAEIDEFASLLLEEAKRFLELAEAHEEPEGQTAYLHAALMIGFSSLEAHVNAVAEEVADRKDVSLHDKAVLMELEVRLEDGQFQEGKARFLRLEDRLMFLHRRFGRATFKKSVAVPSQLQSATKVRNKLTHPKGVPIISVTDVKRALEAIIATIDSLYKAVFAKKLPAASRGLHSRLSF